MLTFSEFTEDYKSAKELKTTLKSHGFKKTGRKDISNGRAHSYEKDNETGTKSSAEVYTSKQKHSPLQGVNVHHNNQKYFHKTNDGLKKHLDKKLYYYGNK